jgi:hypothetical protein
MCHTQGFSRGGDYIHSRLKKFLHISVCWHLKVTFMINYYISHKVWYLFCVLRNLKYIKKVKYTLVQALKLCTGRTTHRGSRGIALLFHDYGTRGGWGVSVTPRPLFTPGKDPVPIVQEAGWAPGPVWTSAENLCTVCSARAITSWQLSSISVILNCSR